MTDIIDESLPGLSEPQKKVIYEIVEYRDAIDKVLAGGGELDLNDLDHLRGFEGLLARFRRLLKEHSGLISQSYGDEEVLQGFKQTEAEAEEVIKRKKRGVA